MGKALLLHSLHIYDWRFNQPNEDSHDLWNLYKANSIVAVIVVIIITYKVTREARKLSHNIETDKTNAKFKLLAKSTKHLQKTVEILFKLCLHHFKIQQIS